MLVHVDGVGSPMGGQQSGQNCENGDFYNNPYQQRENILKNEIFSQILGIDSCKYAECIKLWPKKMKGVLTLENKSQNDH